LIDVLGRISTTSSFWLSELLLSNKVLFSTFPKSYLASVTIKTREYENIYNFNQWIAQ
jgi:hypothetical protein